MDLVCILRTVAKTGSRCDADVAAGTDGSSAGEVLAGAGMGVADVDIVIMALVAFHSQKEVMMVVAALGDARHHTAMSIAAVVAAVAAAVGHNAWCCYAGCRVG